MTQQEQYEKVMRGLECCANDKCEDCPYELQCLDDDTPLASPMAKDVLELLKEQEIIIKALMGEYGDSCDVDGCGGMEDVQGD